MTGAAARSARSAHRLTRQVQHHSESVQPSRWAPVFWFLDLMQVLAGLVLWGRATNEGDEAWALFLRCVAFLDLAFVAFGNGQLLLEIPLLALALALPSAYSLRQRRF